jgi:hypothetical protein
MKSFAGTVVQTVPEDRRSDATRSLLSACNTLCRTRPGAVRSVQVTLALDDLPVSNGSVVDYVQRIAMERGVAARIQIGEKYVSVVLTRECPAAPGAPGRSQSEVVGWVSRFFSWLSR